MGPGLPGTLKNCLPRRDFSVLEKLVKTCPVWLQLGLGRVEAARILHREAAGVSGVVSPPRGRWAGTAVRSCSSSHGSSCPLPARLLSS